MQYIVYWGPQRPGSGAPNHLARALGLSHSNFNTIDMKRKLEIHGSFLNLFSEHCTTRNNHIRWFQHVGFCPRKGLGTSKCM